MTRTATATEPSQSGLTAAPAAPVDEASDKQDLAPDCLHSLRLVIGREPEAANDYERYLALATAVRSRQMDAWLSTEAHQRECGAKRVYYLSLEFLIGRSLQNAVLNLDLEPAARDAVHALGVVLEDLYESEPDAALGNGGLGRLAACVLDSLATQAHPATGFGIRLTLMPEALERAMGCRALWQLSATPSRAHRRDQPAFPRRGGPSLAGRRRPRRHAPVDL